MTDNERYVRDAWELVAHCDGSYRDYPRGTIIVQDVNNHWFDFPSWEAARTFTEAHAEKIRQVREEIFVARDRAVFLSNWKDLEQATIYARVISRLQAVLDDLKRGMKEGR